MTIEEEVASIVNESGNSFHCRVANYLESQSWHIQVSPYYLDGSSNKPREIDLIAEKSWEHSDYFSGQQGTINVKLFIECKYIPQTSVFWFGQKDIPSTREWLTCNTPLRENNIFLDKHHYLSSNAQVAKLFASKKLRNMENEAIYKALNQSLNSMVYLRDRQSIIPAPRGGGSNILATLEMPVIVCNSFERFYSTSINGNQDTRKISDNFQLEVNYAYIDQNGNNRDEFFLIDVVDFNRLGKYLDLVESDKDAIENVIG